MLRFIKDIIAEPWMFIESLLAAVFAFGGFYILWMLVASFS